MIYDNYYIHVKKSMYIAIYDIFVEVLVVMVTQTRVSGVVLRRALCGNELLQIQSFPQIKCKITSREILQETE